MAARGEQVCIGLEAAADMTNHQYLAMRLSAANTVNIASNNAALTVVGVLQDTPKAAGREARVAINGESKVKAGAAITAGVPISHNSSGRAIAATSGLALLGFALEAAGADGDVIRAVLNIGPLAQI